MSHVVRPASAASDDAYHKLLDAAAERALKLSRCTVCFKVIEAIAYAEISNSKERFSVCTLGCFEAYMQRELSRTDLKVKMQMKKTKRERSTNRDIPKRRISVHTAATDPKNKRQ